MARYSIEVVASDGVKQDVYVDTMTVIEEINFQIDSDKEVYLRGEQVEITGSLTRLSGDPIANEKVMLMVSKGEPDDLGIVSTSTLFDPSTRMFEAYTDDTGHLSYVFAPAYGDAGTFTVDAFLIADLVGTSGQTSFTILAVDVTPARTAVTTVKNSTYSKVLTIENIGDRTLQGVSLQLIDSETGDNVSASLVQSVPAQLAAGARYPVTLNVVIPENAPDSALFYIKVTTAEGLVQQAYVRFTLKAAQPLPRLTPQVVDVGVKPGGLLARQVVVLNDGLGTMAGITLVAPPSLPWVSVLNLAATSLAPGATTTFDVIVKPDASVQPGIYVDRIAVTDGTHRGEMLIKVEVASTNIGAIAFVVTNDVGKPVANAEIALVSQETFTVRYGDGRTSTYHEIFTVRTDAAGMVQVDNMPVGPYDYKVTATGHESVRGVVEVMPRTQAQPVEIEMVAAPLQFKWTVEPIVIEDRYEITLNLTFQANIPKPEFASVPPWVAIPNDVQQAFNDQVVLINPSLIAIHDVTVTVVGAPGVTVSSGGLIGDMAAKSSTVFAYHVAAGDLSALDGRNTYFLVQGTFVEFDPVTLQPLPEETVLTAMIPLVNPSTQKVRVVYGSQGEEEEKEIALPEQGEELNENMNLPTLNLGGEQTVSAVVKLEIQQRATMEREGFDARLELTNGTGTELVGLAVNPRVTDAAGTDVTDRFYLVPPELAGIAAVDGSANLANGTTMNGRWILIPGEGLGGTELAGKSYLVRAVMTYYQDGRLKEVVTNEVAITVHPQPKLTLHYYIPKNVLADEPFKLGLLVENDGDGVATNLKIDSGQPKIVDNEAGLLVEFRIVGSSFGSVTGDIVRLVLGDVQPHSFVSGYWIMQSTLDGNFIEFTAELKHLAYKGVEINPLITAVTTEIIQHDNLFADAQDPNNAFTLIDRDGDGFADYLINLWSGLRLPILIPENVEVTRSPTPADRTMELVVPAMHGYVNVVLPDPVTGGNLRSIRRLGGPGQEDTYLSGNNFWRTDGNLYFVDELGSIDEFGQPQAEGATYVLDFRSALDIEEVKVAPTEFDLLFAGDDPISYPSGGLEVEITKPGPGSAVGSYRFVEPVFYLGIPPTVGRATAVQAVITNNGVVREAGLVEFRVIQPDLSEIVVGTVPFDEVRAWTHVYPTVEWVPTMPGTHTLRATLGSDSPDALFETTVTVNEPPFADAGADFSVNVKQEATFDGTRSVDNDGYVVTYFWAMSGDEWVAGMTPNFTFATSGSRTIYLVVKDNRGAMSEDWMQVTVNETRPDLLVEDIVFNPAAPDEDDDVTVTATLRNGGVAAITPATPFHVGFYIDGVYHGLQWVAATIPVGASYQVSVPWQATLGNHLFQVVADDMDNRIEEANENNNRRTEALYPDQIHFADLVPESVVVSVTPQQPVLYGDEVTLTASVRNSGDTDAGTFRVDFYIDGYFHDYAVVNGLPATPGSNTATASIQWAPTGGTHNVEVRVDSPLSHIVELAETNNSLATDLPALNVVYGDLRVAEVTFWPDSGKVSGTDPMLVTAKVRNASTAAVAVPFTVGFYLDGQLQSTRKVDGLGAEADAYLTVPIGVTAGSHQFRIVIDEALDVPEVSDSNNESVISRTITVGAPDLVVQEVRLTPAAPAYGETVQVLVKVRNQGSGRTVAPFNIALTANGALLDVFRRTESVSAGGFVYWTYDWAVDEVGNGNVALTATVDANAEVAESSETNNSLVRNLVVDPGYRIEVSGDLLGERTVDQAGGAGDLDIGAFVADDNIVLQGKVADSRTPDVYLGPAQGISARIIVLNAAGGELLRQAMVWVAPLAEFQSEVLLTGFAEGTYTGRVEITAPDRTVHRDASFLVLRDFVVTLGTDHETYGLGDPVAINGTVCKLDGAPVAGQLVKLTVVQGKTQRPYQATTAADGTYTFVFQPTPGEGGEYVLFASTASHGVERIAAVGFDIQGLTGTFAGVDPILLEETVGRDVVVTVRNAGSLPMTGLVFEVVDDRPNDAVTPTLKLAGTATTLAAGQSTTLVVNLIAAEPAPNFSEPQFVVRITSLEGYQATVVLPALVHPQAPVLTVAPLEVKLVARPGGTAVAYDVVISNTGLAAMTGIAIGAPGLPWLSAVVPPATTLAAGASLTVTLRAAPGDRVIVGSYTDALTVTADGLPAQTVVIAVEVTELITGNLRVHVYDDWKFNVQGAEVTLSLRTAAFPLITPPVLLQKAGSLLDWTDTDGILELRNLPAGEYDIVLTEQFHDTRSGTFTLPATEGWFNLEVDMVFRPAKVNATATQSTERQTLGRLDLSLVLVGANPSDRATLVPSQPAIEHFIEADAGTDYAVLFSGGADTANNHNKYYVMIQRMYWNLIRYFGLAPENIYILFSDGGAPGVDLNRNGVHVNSDMSWTTGSNLFPASPNNLQSVLATVSGLLQPEDHFLLWTYDHGDGTQNDPSNHDEEVLNGWNHQNIADESLASWVSGIDAAHASYLFFQCFSGGMLEELLSPRITGSLPDNQFGMAAANHYETGLSAVGLGFVSEAAEAIEQGLRSTYAIYEYAFRNSDWVALGGPNGDYNENLHHPWMVGDDFGLFQGTGPLTPAVGGNVLEMRTSGVVSLNNPSAFEIRNVIATTHWVERDALVFSGGTDTLDLGTIAAGGSSLLVYEIDPGRLAGLTGDQVFDDGYIEVTGEAFDAQGNYLHEVTLNLPVRIRIGSDPAYFQGAPYKVTPYVGDTPQGPLLFGETFIQQWFKGGRHAAPDHVSNITLSQDVSVEAQVVTVTASLLNRLPDRGFQGVRAELFIRDAAGEDLVGKFNPVIVSAIPSVLDPLQTGTVTWKLVPAAGLGGTNANGLEYTLWVRFMVSIDGHDGYVWSEPQKVTVKPAPALVVRYGIPKLGQPLAAGDTFRVHVTITNNGAGAANALQVRVPSLFGTSQVNGSPVVDYRLVGSSSGSLDLLDFGTLAPGATAEGYWEIEVLAPVRIASFSANWSQQVGAQGTVSAGSNIKNALIGQKLPADLLAAWDRLEQAILDKIDADVERNARLAVDFGGSLSDFQAMQRMIVRLAILDMVTNIIDLVCGMNDMAKTAADIPNSILNLVPDGSNIIATIYTGGSMLNTLFSAASDWRAGEPWRQVLAQLYEDGYLYNDPVAAKAEWTTRMEELMPFTLLKDYFYFEQMRQTLDTSDPEAFIQQLLLITDTMDAGTETVYGTENLKARIEENFAPIRALLGGPLPAYYPIDALWQEFTRIADDLERASKGYGVARTDRQSGQPLRRATSWWSVGEPGAMVEGEWLPPYLVSWEFGTSYEPAYLVDYLLGFEAFQSLLLLDLLQMKMAVSAMAAINTGVGAVGGAPGAIIGMAGNFALGQVGSEIDSALGTVLGHQKWGYEWLMRRMWDLFDAQQAEGVGVWRVSNDVLNHLVFLDQTQLVDPPFPLVVESVVTNDIQIGENAFLGTGTAYLTLTNPGTQALQVTPVMQILGGSEDFGRISGASVVLAAGETRTLTMDYGGIRSLLVSSDGYDVYLDFQVLDPATMTSAIFGPVHTRFYVGTAADLAILRQQSASVPLAGEINTGEVRETTLTPAPGTREWRILMTQAPESNFDLHLYDSSGHHVGLLGATDQTLIAGSTYAGSAALVEWIRLPVVAGQEYRLVVEATTVPLDAWFTVELLQTPDLPAQLLSVGTEITHSTSNRNVEFTIELHETGRQTGVVDVSASASDLVGPGGFSIPAANWAFTQGATTVAAGGMLQINAALVMPGAAPDGTYTGTVTVLAEDAISGQPIALLHTVSLTLDTIAPVAPVLDPVASPVEDGPAVVTGTTTASTAVSLRLDGEHIAFAYPDESGHFTHLGVRIPSGTHLLSAVAIDGTGNESAPSATQSIDSTVDLTPPVTTVSLSGSGGSGNRFSSAVGVSFTASDDSSGVNGIEYSLNLGAWQAYTGGQFQVSQAGDFSLRFRATDTAGNIEDVQSTHFTIDLTAPATTATVTGPTGSNGWFRGAVTVELTATDAGGGPVASSWFSTDGGSHWTKATAAVPVAAAGTTNFAFYSVDAAGNVESAQTLTIRIDAVAPSSSVAPLPAQSENEFVVAWSGSDGSGSGLVGYTVHVAANGGAFTVWLADTTATSASFTGSAGSTYAFYSTARDAAGNIESAPSAADATTIAGSALEDPVVVATIVNGGQAQRSRLDSIALRFNVDVAASLAVGDLVVTSLFSGQAVSSSAMSLAYDPVTFTATWTFPGLAAGTLPDGRFTAVLPAGAVANADGVFLAADHAVSFGVLAGDLDGNGLVNDRDLYAVWTNLLRIPALRDPAADVDRNGTVDAWDIQCLTERYLATLPAAGSAAPSATGVVVGDGTAQRSHIDRVVVTFDAHVGGSLDVADLVITNLVTGIAIDPAGLQVDFDPVALTATWTFPGLPGGVLPDGNYSLSLAAAAVTDAIGRPLAADSTVGFHVLRGDANGDRAVNDLDLYWVWTQSQRPAGQQASSADVDGDGVVTSADLAVVSGHYLATLPAVGAAAPSVTRTVLGDGTAQRSRITAIAIVFDAYVADSLAPSDLVVTNLTTGSTLPSGMMAVAFEPATRTARWTFPGLAGGALPDGNYTAVLAASAVNDLAGRSPVAGTSLSFHVLAGDANADRTTNDADLAFVYSQSQLPAWEQDPAADLDGDGAAGASDLAVIASNYLAFLPAPMAPLPAPTLLDNLLSAGGSADEDADADSLQLTDLGTVPETHSLTVS